LTYAVVTSQVVYPPTTSPILEITKLCHGRDTFQIHYLDSTTTNRGFKNTPQCVPALVVGAHGAPQTPSWLKRGYPSVCLTPLHSTLLASQFFTTFGASHWTPSTPRFRGSISQIVFSRTTPAYNTWCWLLYTLPFVDNTQSFFAFARLGIHHTLVGICLTVAGADRRMLVIAQCVTYT